MEFREALKIMYDKFPETYIETEEYQDKFFLVEDLRGLFPFLQEDTILQHVNTINMVLKAPRRKEAYFKLLARQLFPT